MGRGLTSKTIVAVSVLWWLLLLGVTYRNRAMAYAMVDITLLLALPVWLSLRWGLERYGAWLFGTGRKPMKRWRNKAAEKDRVHEERAWVPWLFLLPSLLAVSIFVVVPFVDVVRRSSLFSHRRKVCGISKLHQRISQSGLSAGST